MTIIRDEIKRVLLRNGSLVQVDKTILPEELKPVVKLSTTFDRCVWLVGSLDPMCKDMMFALSDLGDGNVRLDYISLEKLERLQSIMELEIIADPFFSADKTLAEYFDQKLASEGISILS